MARTKKTESQGGHLSAFARNFLNPAVTSQHLVAASVNPLMFGTAKSVMDLVFSEPFIVNILDKDDKVDDEKTIELRRNLKRINAKTIIRAGANDSLLFGNGISEWAWDLNPKTHFVNFTTASRRPPENFGRKKEKPESSSFRWKGIYYNDDGTKGFDQTVKTEKGQEIRTLDPQQIMCIPSICEIAPDGPGFLEYLSSIMTGASYSWMKIFDVMDNQITPMDVITDDSVEGLEIGKNYVEHHTDNDKVPRPSWVKIEHDNYPDKLDVLEFHKFFQTYILWVIFPTAILNYDGSSALLDASSGASKTKLLFSFINALRGNIAEELEVKCNLWCELNGLEDKNIAQVIAPSTIPTDYQEAVAIAGVLTAASAWTVNEVREWACKFNNFDLATLKDEGTGGAMVLGSSLLGDEGKAKIDAMISALLSTSFADAADEALMPLIKRIEKEGI